MSADIDVIVAGGSPTAFSQNYASYESTGQRYNEPVDGNTDFTTNLRSRSSSNRYISTSTSPLSASPPAHFTFNGRCGSPTLVPVPPLSSSSAFSKNLNHLHLAGNGHLMPVAVPRRPCLVVRCDLLDLPSTNRNKKKVVFADDRGFPLTLVRTMTEPSNMPPRWSFQFLAQVTKGASAEVTPDPWEITFPQPAADYLDFRRRLDSNNVSLENVIVKESEQIVTGTVKVRNLAFHKEVFLRMTSDEWETQEDSPCSYVASSPPGHGVTVIYDTFSFRVTLPPRSKKLQFCVCFRCSGSEYWDNNSGKNYTIVKKEIPKSSHSSDDGVEHKYNNQSKISLTRRFCDDVKPNTQLDSWSEFASWSHLSNHTPYW